MPGGGKPVDLRTLNTFQLVVRMAVGTAIAVTIITIIAVKLYRAIQSGCASCGINVFTIFFYGFSAFGIVFCLVFLPSWNMPVIREFLRRRQDIKNEQEHQHTESPRG